MTNFEILEKNRGLLLKTAQKYKLSLDQAWKLHKYCPHLKTKLLSQDDANKLALVELLHGEGLMKKS